MTRDAMRLGCLLWFTALAFTGCRPATVEDPIPAPEAPPPADVVAELSEQAPPPTPGMREFTPPQPGIAHLGPDGVADPYDQLFVRFTHPMKTALEGAGAPTLSLDPPVEGVLAWSSPYTLIFDPKSALPRAAHFDVHVHGDLVTADGDPVVVDTTFDFETERPELTLEAQTGGDGTAPRHWNMGFVARLGRGDFALPEDDLQRHVKAIARNADGNGKRVTVPIKVRRPTTRELRDDSWRYEGALVIAPRDHWPPNRQIEVVVDEAMPIGELKLGRAVSKTIVTARGLEAKLECFHDYGDGCDPQALYLQFSDTVQRSQLSNIRITPRPARTKIGFSWETRSGEHVEIKGRFVPGKTYRIHTTAPLVDVHGQPLLEPLDRSIKFVEPAPKVTLRSSHGTLRANGKRTVGLETRWVERVRLRAAVLTDQQLANQFMREPEALRLPAKPVRLHEETIDMKIEGKLGWASHAIDLAAISGSERRPVLVEATPLKTMTAALDRPAPETVRAIYQQSDLGALSLVSPSRSLTRVTSLSTNEPVPGVTGELYRATKTVKAPLLDKLAASGADGILTLPRSTTLPQRGYVLLRHDDDRLLTRVGPRFSRRRPSYAMRVSPYAYEDDETVLSEIATERPLYRPGDNVYVVGWSAVGTNHTDAGLRPLPAGTKVALTLTDGDDEEVSRLEVATKASGKYWGRLSIPSAGRLGRYRVKATIGDDDFSRSVKVKDFRTPTFSVDASADRGDVVAGGSVNVGLSAAYYFGGAVPIQNLRRTLRCRQAGYRPPNVDPAWRFARFRRDESLPYSVGAELPPPAIPERDAARGRARMTFDTAFVPTAASYHCVLSVAVRDITLMDVGNEATWRVHPEAYLAVQQPSVRPRAGDRLDVPVRTFDFEGTRRADPVTVSVTHHRWVKAAGGWKEEATDVTTCNTATTATGKDGSCAVAKVAEGRYEFVARRTTGPEPRPEARTSVWVGSKVRPSSYTPPKVLTVEVTPESPKPGDTAKIRISAPYATGTGVLAFLNGGVRRIEPFSLVDGSATFSRVVDQSWVPGIEISAFVPRPDEGSSWRRLDQATERLSLSSHGRALTVSVEAPEVASPNETIEVTVRVRDEAGRPVAGNVTVWAVEEAILALEAPVIPDLADAFVVERGALTSVEHEFSSLIAPYSRRGDPYRTYGSGGGTGSGYGRGSGAGFGGRGQVAPRVKTTPARERFETTPIFIGDAEVSRSGQATVRGRMPENLTTFRITAIASAKVPGSSATGRFGHAEDRTRVTVPLALRAVTPRVMRPGDQAAFAAVIDNLGGPAGTLEVSLALPGRDGVLEAPGPHRVEAAIEAGGQVRVPFAVAARRAGSAPIEMRVRLTPLTGGREPLEDAMKVDVPVEQEATLVRRSALYGSLDDDQPVAVAVDTPADVVPGSGRVDVRLDASLLEGLQDVARDLVEYPYGCVEQTSSGLIPLIALGELARTYPIGVDDVDHHIAVGVSRLRAMQADDGGLGYWPGAQSAHLYGTGYAVWVLEQAHRAGHRVSPKLRRGAAAYLTEAVTRWAALDGSTPHEDVPVAMAIHALATRGEAPAAALTRLESLAPTMPAFARALVVMALHENDPDDDRIEPLVAALAGTLDYAGGGASVRSDGAIFAHYFDSGVRTDAMVLLALLTARPEHEAVEPLARGLMALRAAGRVRNTQARTPLARR
ncbi:MAG: MG2 domain-containing protein [Myxococcota bacterium]